MESHIQQEFIAALTEIINDAVRKTDPEDKQDVKQVTVHFTIKNSSVNAQCPTGCYKQSNGKCWCFNTHF